MKVLHLALLPLPEEHPDHGTLLRHPGRWVLNLAKAQREHTDWEPEIGVSIPGASQDFSTELEGIPVHFLKSKPRFRALTGFAGETARFKELAAKIQPDLIHAHGTEDACGLAATRLKKPFIITVQGMMFLINQRYKRKLLDRARLIKFYETLCLKRTRHVIVKSQYISDRIGKRFPHLTLHHIPNTFDPTILEVPRAARENSLIYVGTINEWKGVHILREGFGLLKEKIPDLKLHIAGNWADEGPPYEKEELRLFKKNWGDDIVLHGLMKPKDLFARVAASKVLVAPSLEDMFGNQAIESLLLETPVVVADHTALAENVRKFGNGTVVPQNNPRALADAVMPFLAQENPAASAAAKEKIIQAFKPEVVAQKHLDAYEQVLKACD